MSRVAEAVGIAALVAVVATWPHVGPRAAGPVETGATEVARRWSVPQPVDEARAWPPQAAPALAVGYWGTESYVVWLEQAAGDPVAEIRSAGLDGSTATRLPVDAPASAPAAAVDSFGRLHLVWVGESELGAHVYHSLREPDGRAWSVARRVAPTAGPGRQSSPAVAADRAGNVHVLWADAGGGTSDILHRRRSPDGDWSRPVRVNDVVGGEQTAPAVADAPSGDLFAVWQDTRRGTNDVYASRLPQFGDLWWPNAELTAGAGPADARSPAVGAADAVVWAVWVDAAARPASLSGAMLRLDPEHPYWSADRPLHAAIHGDVLEVGAFGRDGAVTVAWSESRSDGARIYAADVPDEAVLAPERVDVRPAGDGERRPRVAATADETLLVWQAADRDGGGRVVFSRAARGRADGERAVAAGWLQYRGRVPNCGGETYAVVGCDGSPTSTLVARGADLAGLVGRYVLASGRTVERACPRIEADAVRGGSSPCERGTGSLTGLVTAGGLPVEGAWVAAGGQSVRTGRSGRFHLDGLRPGSHVVTATASCALSGRVTSLPVAPGGVADVGAAGLVLGDVDGDCRVDIEDLLRVGRSTNSTPSLFEPCADLDADGTIGIYDLQLVALAYDRVCPGPWAPATPSAAATMSRSTACRMPPCR